MSIIPDIANVNSEDIIQQNNSIYFLDDTDTSGYVFEINMFDISHDIATDPKFDSSINPVIGLPDVSAIAELDVSLSKFNHLFQFRTGATDVIENAGGLKFGLNPDISNCFDDISFSNATVIKNHVNVFYTEQKISNDYVRHIAKSITGGYNSVDIFDNKDDLENGVNYLDVNFQTLLNNNIDSIKNDGFKNKNDIDDLYDTNYTKTVYKTAEALFKINSNDDYRRLKLFEDISNISYEPSDNEITVPIQFNNGDKIAIRLEYKNKTPSPFQGGGTIVPRSYKILLNLTD